MDPIIRTIINPPFPLLLVLSEGFGSIFFLVSLMSPSFGISGILVTLLKLSGSITVPFV